MLDLFFVIPAKAGIQTVAEQVTEFAWTPAFAGVTLNELRHA